MKSLQRLVWVAILGAGVFNYSLADYVATVQADRLNVRGQPTIHSEVITQLVQDDKVVVLEEKESDDTNAEEPGEWAQIQLPSDVTVWVFANYVQDNTVNVNLLNLRAGPGQNYSILGRVEEGTKLQPVRTIEDWMEIQPLDEAYAFVAAKYLEKTGEAPQKEPAQLQEPEKESEPASSPPNEPDTAETTEPAEPSATEEPAEQVASEPEPASPPDETPEKAAPPPQPAEETERAEPSPAETEPATPPEQAAPEADSKDRVEVTDPVVPKADRRIVYRQGTVKPTFSIKAPTYFELVSPQTGRRINYLQNEIPDIKLEDFKDRRVIVVGEEGLDERWPKTPVLWVEKLRLAP